ncbi:MAG: DUF1804 family protein [Sulfurospirillum sp.]|nr:DUF1804 family protein [Sulfurospirillum sp.]
MAREKNAQIKKLYINGKTINEICTTTGVSRATIYNHKKRDLENGIDWDDLAFSKAIDPSGVRLNEKEFLTTLIKSFEEALKKLDDIDDPAKRLSLLKEYASSYYKLKAPLKNDCKQAVLETASKTVYELSQMALEQENQHIVEFLSSNAQMIIERVVKR